jgi:hypothetical protein
MQGHLLQLSLEAGHLTELREVDFFVYEGYLPASIVGIRELERLGVLEGPGCGSESGKRGGMLEGPDDAVNMYDVRAKFE